MPRWNYPADPQCPEWAEQVAQLHNDPMTAASGVGDEIEEGMLRKHMQTCERCIEHGAANAEVI
jgi:hypothetical protein